MVKKVSRHSVDAELIEEGVESKKALLESVLRSAASRPPALSLVLGAARNYAGYVAVAELDSDELPRALQIGAQAAAAIFALSIASGDVRFDLDGAPVTLPATGPTDATHVGNWRIGWWLAHVVRDRSAIDSLAATPLEVLRQSSSRGDECQYLFVDALQAFEKRAGNWSTRLRVALDATDPAAARISDEEFVLNVLVPEMQMLFRVATGEIEPFNEALRFALERHKKYWSKAPRKRDPDGYLALGPLAISKMARKAGMPIEVDSEYLPERLLQS
jgi:hypothetical protein